jgi:hypothetical protein
LPLTGELWGFNRDAFKGRRRSGDRHRAVAPAFGVTVAEKGSGEAADCWVIISGQLCDELTNASIAQLHRRVQGHTVQGVERAWGLLMGDMMWLHNIACH